MNGDLQGKEYLRALWRYEKKVCGKGHYESRGSGFMWGRECMHLVYWVYLSLIAHSMTFDQSGCGLF